jgi:hypothetical protein
LVRVFSFKRFDGFIYMLHVCTFLF